MEVVENEDGQRNRDASLRKKAERNETSHRLIDLSAPYREPRSDEDPGGAYEGSYDRKRRPAQTGRIIPMVRLRPLPSRADGEGSSSTGRR